MKLTKKESLIYIIKHKGMCTGLTTECCLNCLIPCNYKGSNIPAYNSIETYYYYKYKQAVNLFIKLYGETKLVEILL